MFPSMLLGRHIILMVCIPSSICLEPSKNTNFNPPLKLRPSLCTRRRHSCPQISTHYVHFCSRNSRAFLRLKEAPEPHCSMPHFGQENRQMASVVFCEARRQLPQPTPAHRGRCLPSHHKCFVSLACAFVYQSMNYSTNIYRVSSMCKATY